MGLDIAAIKAKIQQMADRTKKNKDIWKPKDEHDVRLVQNPHGDDPFVELFFHYEIGDNPPILCPKSNYGDECEICDFCDALKSWKTADRKDKPEAERKADWELFKKISAKNRWYVPMIERGKEAEGPKWWALSQTTCTELLKICANAENNEDRDDAGGTLVLTSATNAYDVHVSFAKPGEKGNTKTFAVTEVKEKKKTSKLLPTQRECEELVSKVKNIGLVYPRQTSEEVARAFKKFVGNASEPAKPEGGEEKYPPKSQSAEKPKTGGRTIEDAFGDLTGESQPE